MARLALTRDQILSRRRAECGLDSRVARSEDALRSSARLGHSDSMPRGALLSIHARLDGVESDTWADPVFSQVWGPRFSAYVVAAGDHAPFTVGRTPDSAAGRQRAGQTAERIRDVLGEREMPYRDAGEALGMDPNELRYATTTGTILIRWEGAGKPTIRVVERPDIPVDEARLELVRRHLHHMGPATPESFGAWAGVKPASAARRFDAVVDELVPVVTPIGEAWILAADEESFGRARDAAPARLLPSGDVYTLLWGADRSLLVADAAEQGRLWTPRVWPGAILVRGEVVGTWRRSKGTVTLEPWSDLDAAARSAVESEAESMPIPDVDAVTVTWSS